MATRSITFLSSLLLALSLLGCGSAPLPNPAAPSRPSYAKVTEDLKSRLAKDDRLQGSKIDFDYDGATVILNGTVKDKEQFGWATTVAAGTPGVTSVINRLQVEAKPETQAPEAQTPKPPAPRKQIPKEPAAEPPAPPTQTT